MGATQQLLAAEKAASASSVDPIDVANLELWLPIAALDGTSDGAQVSTWNDQSGNARNGTGVAESVTKPIYHTTGGPTGGPIVQLGVAGSFQGYFSLANFLTGFSSGEAFVVIKLDADPGPGTAFSQGPPLGDWGSATTGALYPFHGDSVIYEEFGSTTRKTTNNPTTSLATWHVYNVRSASGNFTWTINAATSGNDFFNTGTNTVGWGTTPKVGKGEGRAFQGAIVDVIMFSRIIDDATERKAVIHQYLNDTYGFSLPTS